MALPKALILAILCVATFLPAQVVLQPSGEVFPGTILAGSPLPGPAPLLVAVLTAPPIIPIGAPMPGWRALRCLARWEAAWGPPPIWAHFYIALSAAQVSVPSSTTWGPWSLEMPFTVVVRWDIADGDWVWPLTWPVAGALGVHCWLQWPVGTMLGPQTWQLQGFLVTASGTTLTEPLSVTTFGNW